MARRFPAAQSPPSPCCQAAEPNSKPRVAGRGFGEGQCTNPDSCRGLVVFVQQPAEQVPPIHVASSGAGDRRQLTLSLRRV